MWHNSLREATVFLGQDNRLDLILESIAYATTGHEHLQNKVPLKYIKYMSMVRHVKVWKAVLLAYFNTVTY
jgi:hypothetical protein